MFPTKMKAAAVHAGAPGGSFDTIGKPKAMDSGEKRLHELGYKQELVRVLSLAVNFAVSYTIIGVLMGITGLYSIGFTYGGPVGVVWGWVVVSFFSMFVASSMAELCSSLPTAGGLYYWAFSLGGPEWGPFLSWITGWFLYTGSVCGVATINNIGANLIAAMVVINTGTALDGGYIASKEVTLSFLIGLTVIQAICNSLHVKVLAAIEKSALYIEMIGLVVVCVTLLWVSEEKQSAKFVFTHYEPATGTGVHNKFYVFILGMLMSQFTLCAYDAATHLTEETERSDWTAPVSIVTAVFTASIAGFIYILVLTFCIQDPASVLDLGNATGGFSAGAQIYYDAFVSGGRTVKGVIALLTLPLLAVFFSGLSQLAATSRIMFAITRDKAIPLSGFLHWSPAATNTPFVANWVSAILSIGISLFSLKSFVAFNAVASIGVIGAYIGYGIPIFLRIVRPENFTRGPFHLGKWGVPCACVAVVYLTFGSVVFCLPTFYPIDKDTFNWTPVSGAAVFILAVVLWVTYARTRYLGPVKTLTTHESYDSDAILKADALEKTIDD
ncbi:amino acid transporter protein [Klebsormidium nitens]|uniref:Amino acid transporter protein n=1 Tax=Klebsormidium nitens TaxID=105231 RepID=A0A1Y1I1C6_KLENI|nr:amino acid transporter protein [Klebsormidium nitens]|eukprot:GAQ84714.1 amino acid transporter protein [Klebsormidium nitens]